MSPHSRSLPLASPLLASLPKRRLWRDISVVSVLVALLIFGFWRLGFNLEQFLAGLGKLGMVLTFMMPPDPGPRTLTFLTALGETLAIAFLGTAIAAVLALPVAMLAAKNVVANAIVHFLARRSLDTIRGIDALIWALIFINVVGLGPFAGILAIAMSDIGSFGKLFSEAIEGADRKPVEGVISTGGSRIEAFRFGIFPQVLPVIASQILYYFESNTRSATIIGIVGAGGIGLYLANEIQQAEWQKVSFIILLILITVAIIDFISSKLRFAIIGRSKAH